MKEKIDIKELTKENGYDPSEIIENFHENGIKYSNKEEIESAKYYTIKEYETYSKLRKNYSSLSDKIMDSIKKGHMLTYDERLILTNDENWMNQNINSINKTKKIDELNKKIKHGKISFKEFNYLCDLVGIGGFKKKEMYDNLVKNNKLDFNN